MRLHQVYLSVFPVTADRGILVRFPVAGSLIGHTDGWGAHCGASEDLRPGWWIIFLLILNLCFETTVTFCYCAVSKQAGLEVVYLRKGVNYLSL